MSCAVEIKIAQSGQELRKATLSGEESSDPDRHSPTPTPPTCLAPGTGDEHAVPLAHQ